MGNKGLADGFPGQRDRDLDRFWLMMWVSGLRVARSAACTIGGESRRISAFCNSRISRVGECDPCVPQGSIGVESPAPSHLKRGSSCAL